MSQKLLVTTPLRQTWNDKKMIFLGQWCGNFKNFENLNKDDYEIFEYHWDNREKLINDYHYINKLYQKILLSFRTMLNEYHDLNNSERYWKIIIGPWLITFLQIAHERFSNLELFFQKKKTEDLQTIILQIKNNQLIPKTYEEFTRLMLSDTWNHHIYGMMIDSNQFNFPIKKLYKEFKNEEKYEEYLKKNFSYKNKIYNSFSNFLEKIFSKQNILISESYLGLKDEFLLAINYLSLPRYSLGNTDFKNKFINERHKIKIDFYGSNPFEKFIKENILHFMPRSYLEEFSLIGKKVKDMKWAKNPKIIFTSHFMTKTLQSRYTADCLENNKSQLVIGQHGGVYGQYLFSSMQDFEIDVSDKYLSWGWNEKNKKIIPFGIIKNLNKNKYNLKNNNLLMILRSQSRYTHRLNSYSGTNQIKKYFDENIELCKKLNSKIIENNLLLRFHSRKFGWDEDKMFIKNLGNIKIDMGYTKISKLISSAKLVLHTYIGTGYLETLASNIPTIIFANTKECLLNKETLIDLNILKEANIYHEDHTSAANFINSNWNTISSWWFSDSTQNARKHFCLKYSKVNPNKVNDLKKIFNSINDKQV